MSELSTDRWLAIAGIVISIISLLATPFITKSLVEKIFKTLAEWSMFLALTFTLIRFGMQDEPITRLTIISLSMNVSAILVLVFHKMYMATLADLHEFQVSNAKALLEMKRSQVALTEEQLKMVKLQDRHVQVTEKIADNVILKE